MDYRKFKPDKRWMITETAKIVCMSILVGYLFFGKLLFSLFVLPLGYYLWKRDGRIFLTERKKRLAVEFKDMITSLSGNLNAGCSLETAFYKAYRDLMKSGIGYRYITDELKHTKNDEVRHSDKQWRILDIRNFIKAIGDSIPYEKVTAKERLKYRLEYLGYVDYINDKLDRRYIVVTNLDITYSPRFQAYCLGTGEYCEMKIHKTKGQNKDVLSYYNDKPIKDGDILYMKKCKKMPKRRKDEASGNWIPIQGEFEWWLNDYDYADLQLE